METITTPTPWEVKCIGHNIYVEAIDRDALDLPGGGFVCDSQADRTDTPEEQAQMKKTMEFIVLACNAHDELLAAIEDALCQHTEGAINLGIELRDRLLKATPECYS